MAAPPSDLFKTKTHEETDEIGEVDVRRVASKDSIKQPLKSHTGHRTKRV